jgi:hypothetical protein
VLAANPGRSQGQPDIEVSSVHELVARYNAVRLIENNGYLNPINDRAATLDTSLRRAA